MIWLFALAVITASVLAVIDFFVEQYFDGYENIMKTWRRFVTLVIKEYWKLFCTAVTIIFYSFMAGVGFLSGAATLYHYLLKV